MKLAALCIATTLVFGSLAHAAELVHPEIDSTKLTKLYLQSDLIHCDDKECINAISYEVVEWLPNAPGFTVVYGDTEMLPDEFARYEPYVTSFYSQVIADLPKE